MRPPQEARTATTGKKTHVSDYLPWLRKGAAVSGGQPLVPNNQKVMRPPRHQEVRQEKPRNLSPMPALPTALKPLHTIEVADETEIDLPSDTQIMRELAEEEAESKRRRLAETACSPSNGQRRTSTPNPNACDNTVPAAEPASFHILSDDFPSLSQVARVMAQEEADEKKLEDEARTLAESTAQNELAKEGR